MAPARLHPLAPLALLTLAAVTACGGGTGDAPGSASDRPTAAATAVTPSNSAPATPATPAPPAATPASRAPSETSASAASDASGGGPAKPPAGSDPYVAAALRVLPHADEAGVRRLRTMICGELDARPTRARVDSILSGLVEQSGMKRQDAVSLVGLAVRSGCPARSSLLG